MVTLLEHFMKKNCKRQINQFRIEKVVKKGDGLYIKRKNYDSSFDIWVDKKDIVI